MCSVLGTGFSVTGLPEGITFKKPYNYGNSQLRKIMESADDIQFIINDSCDSHIPASAIPQSDDENMILVREEVKSLLAKITGTDVAERVLAESLKLIVEEVEVRELVLTEDERVLLHSCFKYFTPGAGCIKGV